MKDNVACLNYKKTNNSQIIISFDVCTSQRYFTPLHFQANFSQQSAELLGDKLFNTICLNLKVTVIRVTLPCNNINNVHVPFFKLAFLLLLYFFSRHIYAFVHSYIANMSELLQNHGKE